MKLTELLNGLQNRIPVVAVNRRLARRLVTEYDAWQSSTGKAAWMSPPVLTYEDWLRKRLQELGLADSLLTPAQVLRLWETILQHDVEKSALSLLQIPASAKMAVAASQLLYRYETTFTPDDGAADHRSFLRWQNVWLKLCRKHGWLEASQMPSLVADAVAAGKLVLPGSIIFAGFDDLTPSDLRLRQALRDNGCLPVEWQLFGESGTEPVTFMASDMEDEVRTSARWASALLRTDPDCRVAIICPQLEQYQSLFHSSFVAEIDPAVQVQGEPYSERMNMSLGQRLDRVPIVQVLLRLLSSGALLDLNEIGSLLRSPFLGGARSEQDARALADRFLREKRQVHWPLSRLLKTLEPLQVPVFSSIMEAVAQRISTGHKALPGEWAERLYGEIEKLGWPGDRALSSSDFQAVKRFYQALEQLASLDRVSGIVSRSQAVNQLRQITAETLFQPESKPGGIEVLGLLEAVGQQFDHLWILGLHDAALPQPPQPNPFIPLPLQKRLQMPHADAERELAFARSISNHLFAAAPEVVLSWPQSIDGAPCRPSPLLRPFTQSTFQLAESADPARAIRARRPVIESVADLKAAALHTRKAVSGGTGIIKDQAICPFRAFAHHRLRAEGLETPDIGLDGLDRGTLIHTVLELFWQEVVTHEQLLSMPIDEQATLLETVVDKALGRFERQRRLDLSSRQRRLEARRLIRLAAKWLEVDRRRPPFTARVEQRHTETIGQLTLRTRVDRIDVLDNGRIAIVDFKSGQVNPGQWLDQRVTEPQLPIYCLNLSPETLDAVLFAQLRGNDQTCRFSGLARDPDLWPGLKASSQEKLMAEKGHADFDAALSHWRKVLPELGDAFVAGEISVAPVNAESCRYCDIRPLCRIDMFGQEGGND